MRFESVLARQVSRYRQPQLRLWPFVKFRWVLWVLWVSWVLIGFMGSCGFRGEIRVGSALTSQPSPSEPMYPIPRQRMPSPSDPSEPIRTQVPHPTTTYALPIRTHQNSRTPSRDNASPRTFLLKYLLFIFFFRNFA